MFKEKKQDETFQAITCFHMTTSGLIPSICFVLLSLENAWRKSNNTANARMSLGEAQGLEWSNQMKISNVFSMKKKIQWGFTFHLDLKLLKMELHA